VKKKQRVRIYTCKKHPKWSLETAAPKLDAGLKVFCPLCRDDFWSATIGEASERIEIRERTQEERDE